MNHYLRIVELVWKLGYKPAETSVGFVCKCPCCPGDPPTLHIRPNGNDLPFIECHQGCPTSVVRGKLVEKSKQLHQFSHATRWERLQERARDNAAKKQHAWRESAKQEPVEQRKDGGGA